jgi:hypothetical protein
MRLTWMDAHSASPVFCASCGSSVCRAINCGCCLCADWPVRARARVCVFVPLVDGSANFTGALLGPGNYMSRIFSEKGPLFVAKLFDVFLPSSSGLFSHACVLIQRTLQTHPDSVARGIGMCALVCVFGGGGGKGSPCPRFLALWVRAYTQPVLHITSCMCVAQLVVPLLCCPWPSARNSEGTLGRMLNFLHIPVVADCFAQCVLLNHTASSGVFPGPLPAGAFRTPNRPARLLVFNTLTLTNVV